MIWIRIYESEYFGDESVWLEHGVKGYEYFLSAYCFVNNEFVPLENDKWIGYRTGDRLGDLYKTKGLDCQLAIIFLVVTVTREVHKVPLKS